MCGLVGIKPSFGRLSRSGAVPFAISVDHVGVMARSVRDAAAVYDALLGHDSDDPYQAKTEPEAVSPTLDHGLAGLRLATLDGWFREHAGPEALAALDDAARLLGATNRVALPRTEIARAAMNTIVMGEAGAFHAADLRRRPHEFDRMTRDKLLSGAMLPPEYLDAARRFRAWYRETAVALFETHDVLLAPTLPFGAMQIGQDSIAFGGREIPTRPQFTMLTAPLSFIGLPVVTVPLGRDGAMPLGIQIIARPFAEVTALRVARVLERRAAQGAG
jgi:aspartyl-tRNA(Asn)/glutamyl-tRNA(Gln) amidotransferase subunit A